MLYIILKINYLQQFVIPNILLFSHYEISKNIKMYDSKLLLLIKGLDQNELHWFQKFLASPFYNSNKEHTKLFQLIKKHYPDFKPSKLNKENTFEKLYPKQKFNAQKMRKLMHGLAVLVEEFLVAMQIRNNPLEKKKILAQSLGERNIYRFFQKETQEMLTNLEALPYRDAQTYKEKHELSLAYYGHVETSKKKENTPILTSVVEDLDHFYLLQRQRLEFTMKWNEKLFGNKTNTKPLSEIKSNLNHEPIFKIYTLIIKSLSDPKNELLYEEMDDLFKTKIDQLGRKDQLEIIRILLNHLSAQINKGKEGYTTKMLSMYKFGLAQNLMIEKNNIGESTFGNIATVGILAKEFQWVNTFINEYNVYLPQSVKKSVTCLSLGLLKFHEKKYIEVIDLLLNQNFSNSLHGLNSKTILLRTYFELFLLDDNYYDLVLAQTQAFEKFIRRENSISKVKKQMFLNFIRFTRKTTNAILQNAVDKKLYNSIQKTGPMVLKSWLIEKVEATQKKKKPSS